MIGIKDQCFGVEIELTGITREEAAKTLATYFETTPQHSGDRYDSWFVTDREGKQWRIMSDGSIQTEQKDGARYRRTTDPRYCVEMVTPKLTYDEMEKFQECAPHPLGRWEGQQFLRSARPCGCSQPQPPESQKSAQYHVLQRRYAVQGAPDRSSAHQPMVSASARTHAAAGKAAVQ